MRYAWELYQDYLDGGKLRKGIKGLLAKYALHRLRQWDRLAADRVDLFLANSHTVARRIRKVYRRPALVVHPPVAVNRFRHDRLREDFYVTVSRLVPYKRLDLLAAACTKAGRKLVIIGDGPDRERVEQAAGDGVTLLGFADDAVVQDHLERCKGFLFAAEEDFGIVPVEAMAAGAPVIAYRRGGATETALEGETGIFFDQQNEASVIAAIEEFEDREWDSTLCRAHAETFSTERFQLKMKRLVGQAWERFQMDGPWLPGEEPLEAIDD